MRRDLTPTAVVRRPVGPKIAQEDYYSSRCHHVSFICPDKTYVRAAADSFVATVSEGTVTIYAELPNITVKIIYKGLKKELVLPGQHLKEGFVIGIAHGLLKMKVLRALDGQEVQPEFFAEEEVKPKDQDPYGSHGNVPPYID